VQIKLFIILGCVTILGACGTTYNRATDKTEYRPACSMDPATNSDPTCIRSDKVGDSSPDKHLEIFQPTPTPRPNRDWTLKVRRLALVTHVRNRTRRAPISPQFYLTCNDVYFFSSTKSVLGLQHGRYDEAIMPQGRHGCALGCQSLLTRPTAVV